ncbi:hypothetical protein [Corynebacterium striatum]|uniref:hypothetical protein n=1 Tax=Corynebacterium striatum TaxID=43770 RepID=UPI0027BA9A80|nr:hypothetical protein [Corynebacterium striatum]
MTQELVSGHFQLGEHRGVQMSLHDFALTSQLLLDIAVDQSTQPAYARGIFRAMGAFSDVLTGRQTPEAAVQSTETYTTNYLNQLRAEGKDYQ